MHHPPLDFIVLAYPRSGTTWLANWLTTDHSLCLHDPWAIGTPETWLPHFNLNFSGISCTVSALLPEWLQGYSCPIAIIERDRRDCDASLAAAGLMVPGEVVTAALDDVNARRFAFDALWTEDGARALWAHLLPHLPFNAKRYRLLRGMQIQPTPDQLAADVAGAERTFSDLLRAA